MLKFAAIDIGSNAIRLLLSQVIENNQQAVFKKMSLIRMPIRLGEDVFKNNFISEKKIDNLINALTGFKYLINAYEPIDYMACATSAMREAENGPHVVREIHQKCGMTLKIISGAEEAEIIYSNHIEGYLKKTQAYLYIDVGGGSTELTLFFKKKLMASASFNIGTVRMLENKVDPQNWNEIKKWLKEKTKSVNTISAIGSGGNINKIFRMLQVKEGFPVTLDLLKKIYKKIRSHNYYERITKLGLRPDRADVIEPAALIFINIMKWSNINDIHIPQVGLVDGVIHLLYEKYKT